MKPATQDNVFRLVPQRPVHIVDLNRATIMKRDWSQAMKWADKQPEIHLPDARKWGWRG